MLNVPCLVRVQDKISDLADCVCRGALEDFLQLCQPNPTEKDIILTLIPCS